MSVCVCVSYVDVLCCFVCRVRADNQVRVQVVDNLVVVHDLRVRLSAAVDLRFRHGNGAASRACCLAERSVGSKVPVDGVCVRARVSCVVWICVCACMCLCMCKCKCKWVQFCSTLRVD